MKEKGITIPQGRPIAGLRPADGDPFEPTEFLLWFTGSRLTQWCASRACSGEPVGICATVEGIAASSTVVSTLHAVMRSLNHDTLHRETCRCGLLNSLSLSLSGFVMSVALHDVEPVMFGASATRDSLSFAVPTETVSDVPEPIPLGIADVLAQKVVIHLRHGRSVDITGTTGRWSEQPTN